MMMSGGGHVNFSATSRRMTRIIYHASTFSHLLYANTVYWEHLRYSTLFPYRAKKRKAAIYYGMQV